MNVCRTEDDYVFELQYDRGVAIWVASLSDGGSVYMDDDRPGLKPRSAWLRLKEFVAKTNLRVTGLSLKFRGRTEQVCKEASAYFFCKSLLQVYGAPHPLNFYLVGSALTYEQVVIKQYSVPELLHMDTFVRQAQGDPLLINPAG